MESLKNIQIIKLMTENYASATTDYAVGERKYMNSL